MFCRGSIFTARRRTLAIWLPAVLVVLLTGCVRPAGGLVVNTQPAGARVYLEGLESQGSPARFAPVPSGTYKLVIERRAYRPVETTVAIEPNTISTVAYELEPTITRELLSDLRYEVTIDGRIGFVDAEGQVRVEPRYSEAGAFSEGLAAVALAGRDGRLLYSYIDVTGAVVIEGPFFHAEPFSEGLAFVREGSAGSYINHAGDTILTGDWIDGSRFYLGYAGVRENDGTFYLVRRSGEHLDPEFENFEAAEFLPGGAEGIGLLLDREGRGRYLYLRESLPPMDPFCRTFFRANRFAEGLALVVDEGGAGYIDKTGTVVIVPPGFDHRNFSDGLARFRDPETGLTGYIDSAGDQAIPPIYPLAASFSEGRAAFSPGEEWGYIDRNGSIVIEPAWDGVLPFRNGLARVFVGSTEEEYVTSYIDRDGSVVWQHGPADRGASAPVTTGTGGAE